jgi:hypothetical protein
MTDEPKSLGALLFDLPAVRRAKKVNTLSRVRRRLIEPSAYRPSAAQPGP